MLFCNQKGRNPVSGISSFSIPFLSCDCTDPYNFALRILRQCNRAVIPCIRAGIQKVLQSIQILIISEVSLIIIRIRRRRKLIHKFCTGADFKCFFAAVYPYLDFICSSVNRYQLAACILPERRNRFYLAAAVIAQLYINLGIAIGIVQLAVQLMLSPPNFTVTLLAKSILIFSPAAVTVMVLLSSTKSLR